jgi:large conductance mechanosensitive channel
VRDFREFLLRGNVVDLAVAVVIGAAFGAVVTALVADIITPLIAAIFGSHDFSSLTFTINGSRFLYGSFINALMARRRTEPDVDSTTRTCPECLSQVPAGARRCAFCTSELAA